MPKLTKAVVDRAEPQAKQYTIWCSDLKGFGVSINTSGSRSYVVDYRSAEGARRRMTIGRHGPLTTEEARKLAIKTLGSTVQGEDPQLERRTRRKSLTVSELVDQYFKEAEKGHVLGRGGKPKKSSTLATDKSMAEAHIKPLIGRRLVIDLKRADIVKFIRDVQSGKSAKAKQLSGKLRGRVIVAGGSGSATRTVAALGSILSYAVGDGIIETNPTHGVRKPAIGKRDRRLSPDEFKAFGRALDAASADETKPWQGVGILRLAALTGCRIGEVENLKWTEVDLAGEVLQLEDSKTGKSVRPLGAAARAVLARLNRHPDNPYVFPAATLDGRPYAGIKRFYRGLFKAAGLEGITPHVLRHSFASVGADLGFTDSTVGSCLGHSGSGITSRYTHRLDSVLIAAADKIAAEIERQMEGR
ncbi:MULTISPECIES: tyrosine-type recombinase/integrase [Aminobacter]|uniref:tyrosine-type recombinase/integrase n=1 Tax=Aminobacter TaxID=31988 RepID=UPI000D3CC3D2|nr:MULTISPECIES: site-specific integrase [Aminobacter]CAI2936275.1 Tyrosine recombinase XerC [Aminobacter niigataensis]